MHKNQQVGAVYYDTLDGALTDDAFIDGLQNVCTVCGETFWVEVALIDHQMASILKDNKIAVENYIDLTLRTKMDAVQSKVEAQPEFKLMAKTANNWTEFKKLISMEIETVCNVYNTDRSELIGSIREVDGSLAKRREMHSDSSPDLKYVWNLMRTELDAIYAKAFNLDECKLLGTSVFAKFTDQSDLYTLPTEFYDRILLELHSDVDEAVGKMHLVNYVLVQMS